MIYTTIDVHYLEEVKPKHVQSAPTNLRLKVQMDRYQLSELILSSLEDYSVDDLNEVFNQNGNFNISFDKK